MSPADGDGLVTSAHALDDLGLDESTRAELDAMWTVLCTPPPPELAERHIREAAAGAVVRGLRSVPSGRSIVRGGAVAAIAFIATTGLAAADVLPPAATKVIEKVVETVRVAVDPVPDEPIAAPAPPAAPVTATRVAASVDTPTTTEPEPPPPTTTAPAPSTTTLPVPPATPTTVEAPTPSTTVPDDGTATSQAAPPTTTPDDGTATAQGTTTTSTTTTTTTQPAPAPPPAPTP